MEEAVIQKNNKYNAKAITTFVLGLLSLQCCGLFTGIPGMIIFFKARKEIQSSEQAGMGLAIAGLILSIFANLFWVIICTISIISLIINGPRNG